MPTTTDRPSRIAWLVPLGALLWIAFVVAGFLVLPSVLHRSLSAAELNRLPVEQRIPRQQDQWKLQDDVRSALVQGSVGLLALVGASVGVYVGWRQLQLTREGQVTDRFLRAVDQLGSDKVEVRFGGIYALERIARDSPSDRSAITEVLSAYVRRHLPGSELHEGYLLPLPFREPDAQAALSVLCRPPLSNERIVPDSRRLNLSRTDLRRADLRKAELDRADLSSARLEGADLRGAHLKSAILDKANLGRFQSDNPAYKGGADLSHADLTGAKLDDVVGLDLAKKDGTIGLRT